MIKTNKKMYQKNYAAGRPQMYDLNSRIKKATRMIKTLSYHYGSQSHLKKLNILDVGSSTGIIDNELAKYFGHVTGIDIDKAGVSHAQKTFKRINLTFKVDDAMKLSFKDNTFDVVICSQVYEHVPNDRLMMNEIYRVLKPSGVCYFAALNKYWIMEPHHNLPFLSWIPKPLGDIYVKVTGKSEKYYECLRSYWGLRNLTNKFHLHDFTEKILSDPVLFGYEDELPSKGWKHKLIKLLSPVLRYHTPTYFWILEKPHDS